MKGKDTSIITVIILIATTLVPANPIPWPPPASMPLENMHIVIQPCGDGLHATFTGDFTFDYIPMDVFLMLFPVPPDANNIRVWQDNVDLSWTWSGQMYPTILPEMPTIPMIEWFGPFPTGGAVFRVDYEHDLIKRPEEFIFFYAVGTGKYFPTYEKTTTAYFDILLPEGFTVSGVWLDKIPHEYKVIGSHLFITVQSYFGPIENDLIVSLVPASGKVNLTDFAVFASRWLNAGCGWPDWCDGADLNRNGVVNPNDLRQLADGWLKCKEGESDKPGLSNYYAPDNNSVEPNAPGYTLPLDINDVWNYAQMNDWLPMSSIAPIIEQHGFAIVENFTFPRAIVWPPSDIREGFTTFYEHLRRMYMYLFITSDTLLHIYHVQFDETLKEVEENEFVPDINDLTKALLNLAIDQYNCLTGDLQEAAKRNVAYLAVANKLIDPNATVPSYVATMVTSELAKINAHEGFFPSDIFIYDEDYSQYVPRGHYTRSEQLKRYFKTMMWYGRMAMLLKGSNNCGQYEYNEALISVYDAKIQTLQAVLLATSIDQVNISGRTGREIWNRMYAITSFYVGLADDLTPYEYLGAVSKVFGSNFTPTDLEDEDSFFALKAELALLRSPKIYGGTGNIWLYPPYTADELDRVLDKTKGMRFMGQRFIPDSYMFQQLVFPEVTYYTGDWNPTPFTLAQTGDGSVTRGYPRGLDVMAILGSSVAEEILVEEGDTDYVNYWSQLNELKDKFNAFDVNDWNRNLYWSWLYSLRSLLGGFREGYPNFVRTDAWEKKELNAALASWTELRHDTILYAKQSYTPPGLGGGIPPVPNATGYVEPVPGFYRRLLALTNMTQQGLNALNALSPQSEARLINFKNILNRLAQIADKELMNQELSSSDFEYIGNFAKTLEEAITGVSKTGIRTLLVADVHTHCFEQKVVEEGVGYVDLIIVACQLPNGSIILTAGPVLSYYEFKWPMDNRLTDEAWEDLLNSANPSKPTLIQLTPLPGRASNPNPANGASNVNINVVLSWTPGVGATSHDVYFGTQSPGTFQRNQTETTFTPGTLLQDRTYYWRIDEVNTDGKTIGTVWSFKTGGKTLCFPGDTLVWLDGTPVKISEVMPGQKVTAAGTIGKVQSLCEVESVQEHIGTFECYDIVFENGNCISVADNHYFLLDSDSWGSVQELTPGLKLQSLNGPIAIKSVVKRAMPFVGKVYNLKVKDGDCYLVGKNGIIVRDY
jgi:hypothetical protein